MNPFDANFEAAARELDRQQGFNTRPEPSSSTALFSQKEFPILTDLTGILKTNDNKSGSSSVSSLCVLFDVSSAVVMLGEHAESSPKPEKSVIEPKMERL